MSNRYTVEVVKSGQPRPYADTIYHVRVTLEKREEWRGSTEWEPNAGITEEAARYIIGGLRCGFTDFIYPVRNLAGENISTTEDYYRTRLDWIKETAPGVWEFHTTTAFTD